MSRNPRSGKKTNLSQFGLLDIPDINDDDENLDLSDDDFDLEAELAAISGGRAQKPKPRKPAPVPAANLDAMIAESLKDVPSDDEGSGDDDDPDLLNELQALAIDDDEAPAPPPRSSRPAPPPPGAPLSTDSSTISMLQDRITNYTVAEKNAKANGESSRARRFGRGLKTLQDLLKQAKSGKPIKNDDIPPPVMVGKAGDHQNPIPEDPQPPPPAEVVRPPPEEPLIDFSPPEPPAPSPPSIPESSGSTGEDQRKRELQLILQRQSEFKAEALAAKKRGDKFLALGFLKVTKQFDMVVQAHNSGEVMNMDELPTVAVITAALEQERLQQDGVQNSAAPEPTEDTSGGGGGLIMAKTLGEGLHQRLEAFKKQEAKAKEEGNYSKARRMNRIIKQYADAIKRHEAGQPVAVDDLPAPAGYGPLPTTGGQAGSPAAPRPAAPAAPEGPASAQAARRDQVLALLVKRQMQFKEIALLHKKKGELDTALQYLRTAKRFDPLIEAARAGRPVDLSNLPSLPKPKSANKATSDSLPSSIIDSSSVDEASGSDWVEVSPMTGTSTDDAHSSLLNQLESQAKMAKEFMSHCKSMGHVAEAKMYEKLYERVREDLDVVRVATLNNRALPSFHYVTREFSVTQCNTDLGVNDLELTIVRGIAYNASKDMDTYVRFEFPFPQEAPVSDRTEVVKDSINPEYNAVFPLAINRSSRPCLRVFKRHGIKLEVWSKGGWFRSDALLGTLALKLAPLQEHVTLHDSFPLYDGRRPVGGSLEIKLRVRTPILQQEVKTTKHRWLVLDDV
uniref:C2 domain-containing protein n=1 Tax=Heliothis virescens TaxID=7102 RepID=A0A2A4JVH4_HELVI